MNYFTTFIILLFFTLSSCNEMPWEKGKVKIIKNNIEVIVSSHHWAIYNLGDTVAIKGFNRTWILDGAIPLSDLNDTTLSYIARAVITKKPDSNNKKKK